MAERKSEYGRMPDDLYVTPGWVWAALWSVEPWAQSAFDCAPIERNGYDFLADETASRYNIATNPPYKLAEKFVRHALGLQPQRNIAMLLPHAWDTAKTRRDLFEHGRFKAKHTITKRIRWDNIEQKAAGPSMNHAWYVWSHSYGQVPRMGWLP